MSGPVKATRARAHSARTESETQTQRVVGDAAEIDVHRRKWEGEHIKELGRCERKRREDEKFSQRNLRYT